MKLNQNQRLRNNKIESIDITYRYNIEDNLKDESIDMNPIDKTKRCNL